MKLSQWLNEEWLDTIQMKDPFRKGLFSVDVFKNPSRKELMECKERGIVVPDGDFYTFKYDISMIHTKILQKLDGKIKGLPELSSIYDEFGYVWRINTGIPVTSKYDEINIFYLSESIPSHIIKTEHREIVEIFEKAKLKNPTINFINKVIRYV